MLFTRPSRSRSGVSLLECIGSMVLLAAILGMIAKANVLLNEQSSRQWMQRRAAAGLSNLMERAVASEWEAINQQPLADALAPHAAELGLPAGQLETLVSDATDPATDAAAAGKQITLTLTWRPIPAAEPRRASLTTFVYRDQEDQP